MHIGEQFVKIREKTITHISTLSPIHVDFIGTTIAIFDYLRATYGVGKTFPRTNAPGSSASGSVMKTTVNFHRRETYGKSQSSLSVRTALDGISTLTTDIGHEFKVGVVRTPLTVLIIPIIDHHE